MAALDFVAVRANSTHVAFQELNLGRCRQEVLCRLLRFWDSRNIKRDNEFMGITMLFLDEKGSDYVHPFVALQNDVKANPKAFSMQDHRISPPIWTKVPPGCGKSKL